MGEVYFPTSRLRRKILRILVHRGYVTTGMLYEMLPSYDRGAIREALREMIHKGAIERVARGVYRVNPEYLEKFPDIKRILDREDGSGHGGRGEGV